MSVVCKVRFMLRRSLNLKIAGRNFSVLKNSFEPISLITRQVIKFDNLLHLRSNAHMPEALELLAELHDLGVRIPLEYFRSSIDICSELRDVETTEVMLTLARKNMTSSLESDDALKTLLVFAVSKFSRYGHSTEAFKLWQTFLNSIDGSGKQFSTSIARKMFTKSRKNSLPMFIDLCGRIHMNVWNEDFLYLSDTSLGIKEYLLRWSPEDSSKRLREFDLLTAQIKKIGSGVPRGGSDMKAILLQHRVAACLSFRYLRGRRASKLSTDLDAETKDIYTLAKNDFLNMLESKFTERGMEYNSFGENTTQVDHGDVYVQHRTAEQNCLRILQRELSTISSQQETRQNNGNYRNLLRLHKAMLEHTPPHGGADPGANYYMNAGTENFRDSVLLMLEEMSFRENKEYIFHIVELFLSAYKDPLSHASRLSLLPFSSYDDSIESSGTNFSGLFPISDWRTQRSPLLKSHTNRSAPPCRSTDDFFLEMLFCSVIQSSRNSLDGRKSKFPSEKDLTGRTLVEEVEAWRQYTEIGQFAWNLRYLASKYGVHLSSEFYANWIMSLPLIERTNNSGWQLSLGHIMRIKKTLVNLGAIEADDPTFGDAIVSHLCGYANEEAVNYATHVVLSGCQVDCVSPRTWNILLSCCVSHGLKRTVRVLLSKVLERLPLLEPTGVRHAENNGMLNSPSSIFSEMSTLESKKLRGIVGDISENEVGLLRAIFRAHLYLGHTLEALYALKVLRAYGSVFTRSEYFGVIKCLSKSMTYANPLKQIVSSDPVPACTYVLEEMKKDGLVDENAIIYSMNTFLCSVLHNRDSIVISSDDGIKEQMSRAQCFAVKKCLDFDIAVSSKLLVKLAEMYGALGLYEQLVKEISALKTQYDIKSNDENIFSKVHDYCVFDCEDFAGVERLMELFSSSDTPLPIECVNRLLWHWCESGRSIDFEKLVYFHQYHNLEPSHDDLNDVLHILLRDGDDSRACALAKFIVLLAEPHSKVRIEKELKVQFKELGVNFSLNG